MSRIEMLFFGSIAAVVLLSWLNVALRRHRYERYRRYRYPTPPPPALELHPERADRLNLSAVLIMGLVLLATAIGLVKVKEHYRAELGTEEGSAYASNLAGDAPYEAGPPGPEASDTYSPMDTPRKQGVYVPQPMREAPLLSAERSPEPAGYGLQVAVLSDRHRAELQAQSVQSLLPNLEVQLETVQLDGKLHYKVLVGHYPDERSARSDLVNLRKHYPESFPVKLSQLPLL